MANNPKREGPERGKEQGMVEGPERGERQGGGGGGGEGLEGEEGQGKGEMTRECESRIGSVVRIEQTRAWVEIERPSACAKCHAKSQCLSLSGESKQIFEAEITESQHKQLRLGERVTIEVVQGARATSRAIVLAYILPLAVLIVTIATLTVCQINEGVVATVTLLSVTIYFFLLCRFRGVIKQKMRTVIRRY